MNNIWDRVSDAYLRGYAIDKNNTFAYERLVNSLALLSWCDSGARILDLGCGKGSFTRDLESRFDQVYAIDYSKKLLTAAKKLCKKTKFFYCDLETSFPAFDFKFDVVVCKLLLMYIRDLDNIANHSYRVLKPGGVFVVSVTHPTRWLNHTNFKGYLHEQYIKEKVASVPGVEMEFSHRTIQTYINTFAKAGFMLESLEEPSVPDSFVIKFPQHRPFQYDPYRLNLKFIKQ